MTMFAIVDIIGGKCASSTLSVSLAQGKDLGGGSRLEYMAYPPIAKQAQKPPS